MKRSAGRLVSRLTLAAVLLAALGAAGCGRKGPLELPPGAPGPVTAAPGSVTVQGMPQATPASKRPSPLDWLLD